MRGGWSGFGMVTVGIHPTDFELNPTKIPPGGVVQNCRYEDNPKDKMKIKIESKSFLSQNSS